MPDIRMTPGDRSPGRYRRTVLSGAMVALVAGGATFSTMYDQFVVREKEANRLVAYQDGAGIWTICGGLTRIDGIRVKRGDRLSKEQCDFYNQEHAEEVDLEMAKRLPGWMNLSVPARVGIGSFCWTNVGWEKCKRSSFYADYVAGKSANEYCAQITLWIRDGGKDCRRVGSNCQGQPIRRMQEDELCLIPKGDEL